ncbi:hypothetical protein H072_10739 [Dactylellina haptotyla CBS 200.50]|uniref:N-acetyltransferase domain-containing protein n=1 Tax=Dactylellina haptotyla (strain CBS 200.50) TaxID=1284197 RepID=S8BKH6_DACHA|nr:hypothetical protein H072_10739 [Dactylellina haptotyla CBS 200.50]
MAFPIQQVVESDIPELVKIHSDAFKTDQFSNFMLSGKPPGTHESLMERSLNAWFSDPTVWMVKAVDEDGSIVGWACWLTKIVDVDNTERQQPSKPAASQEGAPADTPARVVGRQMRNDSVKWERDSMTENKYLVLQALATSPEYQGRGVASQLVKWGVDRADDGNLTCWCHASPAGNQLYRKAGFQELGNSEYDLGEFGKYTFRYMRRLVL